MEATDIAAAFSRLETHTAWSSQRAYLQEAYNAAPLNVSNKTPLEEMRRQVAYLEAKEAEDAARMALIAEVAAQEEAFLPLPYLVGAVAALSITRNPSLPKRLSERSFILSDDPFANMPSLHGVPAEQDVRPSKNPIERAVQIGDEIVRLKGIFAVRGTVPVTMVWHYNFNPPRRSYSEVVTGNVPAARAFVLRRPRVSAGTVAHGIPTRLSGIVKDEVITKNEYIQPEKKYQDVPITSLTLLVEARHHRGLDDPDVVYIGKEDVAQRVKRARADNKIAAAEREAWQQRPRRANARRRYR
jgi:hypothetical protein